MEATETEFPRLVKTAEMAKRASVSPRLLFDWRREGCPHIQRGNLILFDPREVIEWAKVKYQAKQSA